MSYRRSQSTGLYTYGNVKEGGFFIDGVRYRKVPEATSPSGVFNAVATEEDEFLALYADDDVIEDIPDRAHRCSPIELEDIIQEFRSEIVSVEGSAQEAANQGESTLAGWLEEDAEDLREILGYIEEGRWKRAYRGMRLLDSAVREYIPREMMCEIYDRVSEQEGAQNGDR